MGDAPDLSDLLQTIPVEDLIAAAAALPLDRDERARLIRKREAELKRIKRELRTLKGGPNAARKRRSRSIAEVFDSTDAEIRDVRSGKLSARFIETQWGGINKAVGGWACGALNIVAARPSVGKTTVLECDSVWQATRDRGVIIASLEMVPEMVVARMGKRISGLRSPVHELFKKRPSELTEAEDRLYQAFHKIGCRELRGLPIEFLELEHQTWECFCAALEDTLEHWPHRVPPALVYIDYLGLFDLSNYLVGGRKENSALGALSRDMAEYAKKSGLAWIPLHQLNRSSAREDRPPKMTDLRDSGKIEQDATLVLMPYRPLVDNPSNSEPQWKRYESNERRPQVLEPCKWVIGKGRNGANCVLDMLFKHGDLTFIETDPDNNLDIFDV